MQGLAGLSLYAQSRCSASMRQLGTAMIHGAAADLWRRKHGYHVDTYRNGRRVSIVVTIPRIWLLAFGLRHWWVAWRTTRIARRIANQQQIDLEPNGRCKS